MKANTSRRGLIALGSTALIIALVVFMVGRLPPPYDTDLSRLGEGRPAAVIIHDHNTVDSIVLMQHLDELRAEYEPALLLLLADFHRPDGRAFAERYDLPRASLTLFDARGEQVQTYTRHREREDLVRFLEQYGRPLMP
jgi:hypothetical protein